MEGYCLIDGDRSGIDNMQLDHQMLCHAAACDRVLFRVYRWREATQTLGYFQAQSERERSRESSMLPCVRRATGGGAIVHHHDWTYSIAIPRKLCGTAIGAAQPIYDLMHDSVVAWLGNYGAQASKWSQPTCKATTCSFLCFERRTLGDVVLGDSKVMGSAQRRYRGALLQHGSLLLRKSEHAPSLNGLAELGVEVDSLDLPVLSEHLVSSLNQHFSLDFKSCESFDDWISHENRGEFGKESWENRR